MGHCAGAADGNVVVPIYGEACEFEFFYTLATGERLTPTAHAVYLPRPRVEISGPQGVQATFDWQAASDPVVCLAPPASPLSAPPCR